MMIDLTNDLKSSFPFNRFHLCCLTLYIISSPEVEAAPFTIIVIYIKWVLKGMIRYLHLIMSFNFQLNKV